MTKFEILEALKQMPNVARLEIIEFASRLIREEMARKNQEQKVLLEVDQSVTTHLSPNSAEAKALERTASPIADDEWIVVDQVGQEIDMDAVKERFRQSGYKSKISAKKTSSSGKRRSTQANKKTTS